MAEKGIEPALTEAEWADGPRADNRDMSWVRPSHVPGYVDFDINEEGVTPYAFAAESVIAVANHALPDSDPRKITREKIAAMREALGVLVMARDRDLRGPLAKQEEAFYQSLIAALEPFADALESYLPPTDG